jgi:uncharacterized protein (TIGR02118 family)
VTRVPKLIGLLSDRSADPKLATPHLVCRSDATNAILAALAGAAARPETHAGLVLAWPRDAAERAGAEAALAPHTSALYHAREVLHWDELAGLTEGTVALIYLVRRRADLSPEAFMTHYRERHAPLARIHHPGIARYVQNFLAPSAPVDAISELWFESEQDARTRFYRDDESRRVIAEDVQRFIDLRGGTAFAVRPEVSGSPPLHRG